jgi:hypothetical protein
MKDSCKLHIVRDSSSIARRVKPLRVRKKGGRIMNCITTQWSREGNSHSGSYDIVRLLLVEGSLPC